MMIMITDCEIKYLRSLRLQNLRLCVKMKALSMGLEEKKLKIFK